MARWDDFAYGDPGNRADAVKRILANAGYTDDAKRAPATSPAPPAVTPHTTWLDQRDGLRSDPESLAHRLGYAYIKRGPTAGERDAELQSLDEAARQ